MKVYADLEVTPMPGEPPIAVRERVTNVCKELGFHVECIGVETEDPAKPAEVPAHIERRIYQSPLYPGTDEFHEFYVVKTLT